MVVLLSTATYSGNGERSKRQSTLALAAFVRPVGDGRVCVTTVHGGPCVFDFNDEGGAWRLTGYEGPLRLPDASPSPKRPRA